jgi:CheY-like chemotaxis protein
MPSVLICAPDPLTDELRGTLVWRDDMTRQVARRFQEALIVAVAERPDLIVVDSSLTDADRLVADLRLDAATATTSIAVVATEQATAEKFLDAGANAVLRLPAGPDWDEKLAPLLLIPGRRARRVAVDLAFHGKTDETGQILSGTALNISVTGMLVSMEAAPPVGSEVAFSLTVGDDETPVTGRGRIVREDPRGRGVRFATLDEDGRDRIRQIVVSGSAL